MIPISRTYNFYLLFKLEYIKKSYSTNITVDNTNFTYNGTYITFDGINWVGIIFTKKSVGIVKSPLEGSS